MSKKWYPVIDYEKCVQCGTCVDMCRHGVYDKAKAPEPVVVFPEGCVEGCKGCGNKCPAEAIQYVGDVGAAKDGGCGCGCTGS
jgi:NAD-dependent dihydropyrimidine dehydrogenase PreA subunit